MIGEIMSLRIDCNRIGDDIVFDSHAPGTGAWRNLEEPLSSESYLLNEAHMAGTDLIDSNNREMSIDG